MTLACLTEATPKDCVGEDLPVKVRGDVHAFPVDPDNGIQCCQFRERMCQLSVHGFNESHAIGYVAQS